MDTSNTMNVIQICCKIIIQKYYIQFQGQKMREKDFHAYIYIYIWTTIAINF
jgi:hypothetical protein